MPIYAYKCASCGHAKDVLQKISDAPLSVCPACGAASFAKQVTAAGFQLKGSGWYVTDFRDNGKKKDAAKKSEDTAKTSGDSATSGSTEAAKPASESKPDGGSSEAKTSEAKTSEAKSTASSAPPASAPASGA
jgi:putative FmdB family regulatory protein